MSESLLAGALTTPGPWPGWCCSYCAAPLGIGPHGAVCAREGRWFATQRGVHRLLTQERRRELQPALEAQRRVARAEATRRAASPTEEPAGRGPDGPDPRPGRLARALSLAAGILGRRPWRVLDVGAGNCWASARLLALGHAVVAVDIDLDEEHGLLAADRLLDVPSRLPRAEADMEALPLEPAGLDLVLAAGVLHHAADAARTLVELRRVTRRGGLLVAFDSPVYATAADGERMMAERAEGHRDRYGFPAPPFGRGYLVRKELFALFAGGGWRLQAYRGPGRIGEIGHELVQAARWGRRAARHPILIARRDG